jgi:hypothetical protein
MKSFKSFSQEISQQPLEEKNKPTSPEKWARAKAAAKSKFDIYPSAYANAWAAKKYKSMGGGWRSTNEDSSLDEKKNVMDYEEPHMTKNQLRSLIYHTNDLLKMLSDDPELPEWVEAKITLAQDYILSVTNFMRNELNEEVLDEKSAAWQRKEGKNPEGGLNKKGIASYRRENPGSKLSMAVTTPPSKLKKGSKAAKRRKSFCARMGGMPGPMKDEKGRPTRKALSLRKWNC